MAGCAADVQEECVLEMVLRDRLKLGGRMSVVVGLHRELVWDVETDCEGAHYNVECSQLL